MNTNDRYIEIAQQIMSLPEVERSLLSNLWWEEDKKKTYVINKLNMAFPIEKVLYSIVMCIVPHTYSITDINEIDKISDIINTKIHNDMESSEPHSKIIKHNAKLALLGGDTEDIKYYIKLEDNPLFENDDDIYFCGEHGSFMYNIVTGEITPRQPILCDYMLDIEESRFISALSNESICKNDICIGNQHIYAHPIAYRKIFFKKFIDNGKDSHVLGESNFNDSLDYAYNSIYSYDSIAKKYLEEERKNND